MSKLHEFACILILLFAIFCFVFSAGCGGGFREDSSNAQDIGDSIFGADSGR